MKSPTTQLPKTTASPITTSAPLSLHLQEFKKNIDKYTIIDCREASEFQQEPVMQNAKNIPLGQLLHEARNNKLEDLRSKHLVIVCNSGHRARIAAQELSSFGFPNVKYLEGGYIVWKDPAACSFDFVVVLGKPLSDKDAVTMAWSFATASQKNGNNTVMVLSSDGVECIVKGKVDEKYHLGEPFVPLKKLMDSFVAEGLKSLKQ